MGAHSKRGYKIEGARLTQNERTSTAEQLLSAEHI